MPVACVLVETCCRMWDYFQGIFPISGFFDMKSRNDLSTWLRNEITVIRLNCLGLFVSFHTFHGVVFAKINMAR